MQNFAAIARHGTAVAASLVLLLACSARADEIYKWVDKDGKTHYSSRKEDADGATTKRMPSTAPAPLGSAAPPAAQAANEGVIRRNSADPGYPRQPAVQMPAARNYASEADSAKCQLARDILAGRASHRSGAQVDAYDRQTAENDVRAYCGK